MKRLLLLPLLVLAACGPSEPALAPEAVSLLSLEPPPVYALLGYRDRLNLTSPQVVALDSIAQQAREANRPANDQLRDPRSTPNLEQTRALVEQIRQNNRRAAEGVHAVLTAPQRTETCTLFGGGSEEDEPVRRPPRTQGHPRPSAADTLFAPRRGPVWYWCTAAADSVARGANPRA